MDPTTASYYRSILFGNGNNVDHLPASLVALNAWTQRKLQNMGLNAQIRKETAMAVVLTWMAASQDGRQFAAMQGLSEVFDAQEKGAETKDASDKAETPDDLEINWGTVATGTPVHFYGDDGKRIDGVFAGRQRGRNAACRVKIDDDEVHVAPTLLHT